MPRAFGFLLRALSRVARLRFLRALLWLFFGLWLLDRAVWFATDAAWFDSVGQRVWWEQRLSAQLALGVSFWLLFFFASIGAMRAAAHPLERGAVAPPLSGALEPLDAWRARAPRNAWLVLLGCAFFGARAMANLWPQWLAWRASSDPIHALSFVDEWLRVVWPCALVLLGATAFAGILRALPFLAQRRPQQPGRLWRALTILGALVLLLRGAGYAIRAWDALWRDGTIAGEIFLGLPLGLAGVALCVFAAIVILKRARVRVQIGVVVAALVLPTLLSGALSPLGALLPTTAALQSRNESATRAGWNLTSAPRLDSRAAPLETSWPLWDETTLVGAARARLEPRERRFIDWRAASLDGTDAIVTGVPASLDSFGSPRAADEKSALAFLALDAAGNLKGLAPERPNAPLPLPSFYGIEGPALLGENGEDVGVPFRSWAWKLAWAWRLRDPILPFDGARAPRLLALRGARETAQKLAPLIWSEPQLRGVASSRAARWQLIGYDSSERFRGAYAVQNGAFAGKNAVAAAVVLEIDPRSGRAEFVSFAPASSTKEPASSTNDFALQSAWKRIVSPSAQVAAIDPAQDIEWVRAQSEIAARLGETALSEIVISSVNNQTQLVGRVSENEFARNIQKRLRELDESGTQNLGAREGDTLEKGRAIVWPDARAPGGFWLGRAYFVWSDVPARGRAARLRRVALSGISPSPIGSGTTAQSAKLDFQLKTRPQSATGIIAPGESLELRALRAYGAAQDAAKRGDWTTFARESTRQKQLLEQLAARATR